LSPYSNQDLEYKTRNLAQGEGNTKREEDLASLKHPRIISIYNWITSPNLIGVRRLNITELRT